MYNLNQIINLLFKQKKVLISTIILGVIVGITISLIRSDIYQGRACIQILVAYDKSKDTSLNITAFDIIPLFESVKRYAGWKKTFLPKSHDKIEDLELSDIRGVNYLLWLNIESKNNLDFTPIVNEFLESLSKTSSFTSRIEQRKKVVEMRLSKLNNIISNNDSKLKSIEDKILTGDLPIFHLNLFDIQGSYLTLFQQKQELLNELTNLNKFLTVVAIWQSDEPIRPKILNYGIIGAIAGIILGVFIIVVIESYKNQLTNSKRD